jgi:hypothetical protein
MSPITAKATERRVLDYHVQQLKVLLSKLDQGLVLAGVDPEDCHHRRTLVYVIRECHARIGSLCKASADTRGQMYLDNRGLTP